jgi:DNA-binding CsgD family transcriptional regulator
VSTPAGPLVDLLDREWELLQISRFLDHSVRGEGAAVHVIGPPGIGKSTLLAAAAAAARRRGVRVLSATAHQLADNGPFGLLRQMFDRPVMALSSAERTALTEGPARVAIEHILNVRHPGSEADLLASLYWLLDGLSALDPLLLVADDVQWADSESLLWLASLSERLADLPVLLLVGVREVGAAERSPALAALLAATASTLRLNPLSTSSISALLGRIWHGEVSTELTAAAAETTGGNPFLLLALARMLAPQDRTVERLRAEVPGSVVDSVIARLTAAPAPARRVAEAVAVLERCSLHQAAALAGVDLAEAAEAADHLRHEGLLSTGTTLEFRHAILRGAAESLIGPDALQQLRRRAARLLAEPTAAAAQLLATVGTGDPWVTDVLHRAAADALTEGATQTAVSLLRRAIAEPPPPAELAQLLLELGTAELRAADPSCVATLTAALPMLTEVGEVTQCALALAGAYGFVGLQENAVDVLERALAAGPGSEHDTELEAALVAAELLVPTRVGDARGRLAARSGLAGDTRGERLFAIQQLVNAAGTNQPAETIRTLAERAIHPDDPLDSTDWVWARLVLVEIGEYAEVRRLSDLGLEQAAASGSVIGFVAASFLRGLAELWSGALRAAEANFRSVLEAGAGLRTGLLVPLVGHGNLAQCLIPQGRLDEAEAELAGLTDGFPSEAPINGVVAILIARSLLCSARDDAAGALHWAESIGALASQLDVDSPTWVAWRALAIEPLHQLGRLDDARRLASEHLALCQRSGVTRAIGEAQSLAGLVASDEAERLALLARAVDTLTGAEGRLVEAVARVRLGAALRRTGRRAEARRHLQLGWEIAQECGAEPTAARAADELRAAGVVLDISRPPRASLLTASELSVADLAAAGLTNNQIARRLFVSPKTVETHLTRAYQKLGVSGRKDLASVLGTRGDGSPLA